MLMVSVKPHHDIARGQGRLASTSTSLAASYGARQSLSGLHGIFMLHRKDRAVATNPCTCSSSPLGESSGGEV